MYGGFWLYKRFVTIIEEYITVIEEYETVIEECLLDWTYFKKNWIYLRIFFKGGENN